ncbi:DUF3987 domain-containing protein [Guyparkeria hydrothermalis]|uniref:YfjI family protein n=1 Tax=Guyparkeria hydrothermalis TaxID=923 RepID=UPI002020950C|nr:YfjI family protein [Guyparkeria hydrothermalis]MCL7751063.1 DUF3987 domain-containing protein [Guyparkeria hydrothermalis]
MSIKERAEAVAWNPLDSWPRIKTLKSNHPPVQSFDFALLPDAFRPWVADAAERIQCPPDFIAVAIMVAASSVIGRKRTIQPKRRDDWRVTPNLWGAIVGRPGVMKSPGIKAGLVFVQRLATKAGEEHEDAKRKHEIDVEVAALVRNKAKTDAKKATDKEDHQKARDYLEDARQADNLQAPPLRRPLVNDTTVEALGEILIDNPHGTLAFRDELVGLLKSLDKDGQEGARGFYLQAFDGDQGYTFDRIGRGKNLHIPAVCLSLLGGIQPAKLQGYVRDAVVGAAGDDGLIQRFSMMVFPDVSKGWRNVDRFPDSAAKARAGEVFDRLEAMNPDPDESGQVKCLRFDEEALEIFVEWHTEMEMLLRSDQLHPAIESHLSKYRKLVPALSLICALVDGRSDAVSSADLERAIAWANYLRTHAERIYAEGSNQTVENAKTVAGHLRKGALKSGFTASEVRRRGWSGLSTPQAVVDALETLEEHGYIRGEQTIEGGPGRPTIRYQINPEIGPDDRTGE